MDAVVEVMQMGIPVARMEIVDAESIEAVNAYSQTAFAASDTLFFELHGSPAGVEDQVGICMLPIQATADVETNCYDERESVQLQSQIGNQKAGNFAATFSRSRRRY